MYRVEDQKELMDTIMEIMEEGDKRFDDRIIIKKKFEEEAVGACERIKHVLLEDLVDEYE
jgi:hypothetical protein